MSYNDGRHREFEREEDANRFALSQYGRVRGNIGLRLREGGGGYPDNCYVLKRDVFMRMRNVFFFC